MDRKIPVRIDHVGIINRDLTLSASVFLPLGFATGGQTQMDVGMANEAAPTNMHFMLDNSYIECIKTNPGDYLEPYLGSQAGLHTIVLCSDGIEETHKLVSDAGYSVSSVMVASRPADHGANKGQARFGWVKFLEPFMPQTLLGIAQHLTKDLIYQPGRYRHANTAMTLDEIVVCFDDESFARRMADEYERVCGALGETDPAIGIHSMRIMDSNAIADVFGVRVDPARSPYAGLRIGVERLAAVEEIAARQGFVFHQTQEGLVVDALKPIGLFLVFYQKPETAYK